jgi:uncharacterized protein (TIGR04222 family)
MYGPYFLVFYFVVILAIIFVCRWKVRRLNPVRGFIPPTIPQTPDPFEIAYLRGGTNEVARLIVFDLLQRQLLVKVSDKPATLLAPPNLDCGADLPPIYDEVRRFFERARPPHELLTSKPMHAIAAMCETYLQTGVHYQLLTSRKDQARVKNVGISGAFVVILLGLYKLAAALVNGHNNVGFLLLMGTVDR